MSLFLCYCQHLLIPQFYFLFCFTGKYFAHIKVRLKPLAVFVIMFYFSCEFFGLMSRSRQRTDRQTTLLILFGASVKDINSRAPCCYPFTGTLVHFWATEEDAKRWKWLMAMQHESYTQIRRWSSRCRGVTGWGDSWQTSLPAEWDELQTAIKAQV